MVQQCSLMGYDGSRSFRGSVWRRRPTFASREAMGYGFGVAQMAPQCHQCKHVLHNSVHLCNIVSWTNIILIYIYMYHCCYCCDNITRKNGYEAHNLVNGHFTLKHVKEVVGWVCRQINAIPGTISAILAVRLFCLVLTCFNNLRHPLRLLLKQGAARERRRDIHTPPVVEDMPSERSESVRCWLDLPPQKAEKRQQVKPTLRYPL